MDYTASAIIALAVMNGSINTVIAWLTIRLDGHSNDALEHLDTIMSAMEVLDETMLEANDMVESFTTDLDSAKALFDKVGVDLGALDLEPVAEVVEKLKENKDELNEILSHMKDVDENEIMEHIQENLARVAAMMGDDMDEMELEVGINIKWMEIKNGCRNEKNPNGRQECDWK